MANLAQRDQPDVGTYNPVEPELTGEGDGHRNGPSSRLAPGRSNADAPRRGPEPMIQVLDVQRVPATGDPGVAVRAFDLPARMPEETGDLLVVGGGTGGVAAALAASRAGLRVSVLEETSWIGGQFTSQGISALDEHEYIESFGGTRSYYELRDRIRAVYRSRYPAVAGERYLNPGGSWVTRLAFEPRIGVSVLTDMLAPQVAAGRLAVHVRRKAVAVEMAGDRFVSVTSVGLEDGTFVRHRFSQVIDATELGDLLPMAGLPYALGAETIADTGEPHAQPAHARPEAVQSLTYPVAPRLSSGASREADAPAPPDYATYRVGQPYALDIHVRAGEIYGDTTGRLAYDVFDRRPNTKGGLWDYRRLLDGAKLGLGREADISIFNWPGNDYRDRSIVDRPLDETAASLQAAKWVSLGFLHWIRTEAPRAGAGRGYPKIVPAPDIYGTPDALALHPYIREGRRIIGLTRIVEHDVSVEFQSGARARHFDDSAGVGWYPIDIHAASADDIGVSTQTRPFQIPLGALVPRTATNLLAGGKNLATTHITNGCYRLHPVEWNVGESAGRLAAFCQAHGVEPAAVIGDVALLRSFQAAIVAQGVPLAWFVDVGVDHPAFASLQMAAVADQFDSTQTTSTPAGSRRPIVDDTGSTGHACRARPSDASARVERRILGAASAPSPKRACPGRDPCSRDAHGSGGRSRPTTNADPIRAHLEPHALQQAARGRIGLSQERPLVEVRELACVQDHSPVDDHGVNGLRAGRVHQVADHVRGRVQLRPPRRVDHHVRELADLERTQEPILADGSSAAASRHPEHVLCHQDGAVAVGLPGDEQRQVGLPEQVEVIGPVPGIRAERDVHAAPPELGVAADGRRTVAPHHGRGGRPDQGRAGTRDELGLRVRQVVGMA